MCYGDRYHYSQRARGHSGRTCLPGRLADTAALAHGDLLNRSVQLFEYEPFAARVWELRDNVTAYDGWYVALAETLDARLATLDVRLLTAVGPRCAFATPQG